MMIITWGGEALTLASSGEKKSRHRHAYVFRDSGC
jgi:hypothetical protein